MSSRVIARVNGPDQDEVYNRGALETGACVTAAGGPSPAPPVFCSSPTSTCLPPPPLTGLARSCPPGAAPQPPPPAPTAAAAAPPPTTPPPAAAAPPAAGAGGVCCTTVCTTHVTSGLCTTRTRTAYQPWLCSSMFTNLYSATVKSTTATSPARESEASSAAAAVPCVLRGTGAAEEVAELGSLW